MKTWNDLFAYIDKKCHFHYEGEEKPENLRWKCEGDLRRAQEFCEKHGADWESVKERLHETGGFCDCEVLFNTTGYFEAKERQQPLPISQEN